MQRQAFDKQAALTPCWDKPSFWEPRPECFPWQFHYYIHHYQSSALSQTHTKCWVIIPLYEDITLKGFIVSIQTKLQIHWCVLFHVTLFWPLLVKILNLSLFKEPCKGWTKNVCAFGTGKSRLAWAIKLHVEIDRNYPLTNMHCF